MEIDADLAKSRQRLVLLVDGDEQSRLICRTALSDAGFEVITASDGATALLVAGLTSPDVILLDIDGRALDTGMLTREIRAHGHLRCAQLIALTNQLTSQEQVELHTGQFDQIILRPVEPQRILESVNGALITA